MLVSFQDQLSTRQCALDRRDNFRMALTVFLLLSSSDVQAALQGDGSSSTEAHRTLELLMVSYLYDAEEDAFLPIPDMPPELPLQLHNAISQLQAIAVSGKLSTCPCLFLESLLSLMPLSKVLL